MENRATSKSNSYFIIDDCVNQETESLLTVDSKSIFSPKPSNINTSTISETLGDCYDPLTQENVSEALERKSNNVEQPVSFEPFTTLFNRLFEEIISLRNYVNEQLENVKKSQYDSKQSWKCNHSTETDELQHLREKNRSENSSSGNNEMKEVLPDKENTFIEPSRKHSFKANKRLSNQQTGKNVVFQNRFEILDVESNFTGHEIPNRRENLNISNPSKNANNSLSNNFSNKRNSTRWQAQVVINQNPENDNDYRKSKFVPGDKLYSEAGKHHSSTSNNNNIVVFGDSIPNFSRKCKSGFNRNIISARARFKHFPFAISKDLLCYVDATLQDATYDAAIIHVGVNDILNKQSHNQTTQLTCSLRKISARCKSYGLKHVFVSSLLYTSKIKETLWLTLIEWWRNCAWAILWIYW